VNKASWPPGKTGDALGAAPLDTLLARLSIGTNVFMEHRDMTRTAALISSAATALLLVSVQSWAQEQGEAAQGRILAQQVCAECHAINKSQTESPNKASPPFETIARVPGMTSIALTATLQTSHRSMPNLILDRDS
jgi:mono/diheme cytochrome c family protein